MKLLTALSYAAGWLIGQGIRVLDWVLQDTGTGRGETAEVPETCGCGRHDLSGRRLPDPPLFDQDAPQVLAGSDLDYARVPALPDVPFGTGESLARELTDYLRSTR